MSIISIAGYSGIDTVDLHKVKKIEFTQNTYPKAVEIHTNSYR